MIAPDHAELLALPQAWTPGTNGVVKASVVHVNIEVQGRSRQVQGPARRQDRALRRRPRGARPHDKPDLTRYDEKSLAEVVQYEMPGGPPPLQPRRNTCKRVRAAPRGGQVLRRGEAGGDHRPRPRRLRNLRRPGRRRMAHVEAEDDDSRRSRWSPSTSGASRGCSTGTSTCELELDVRTKFIDENQMQCEHDRGDSGHRQEGRSRHDRRPPRFLARRHRRDRQRRRLGRDDGGRCGSSRP